MAQAWAVQGSRGQTEPWKGPAALLVKVDCAGCFCNPQGTWGWEEAQWQVESRKKGEGGKEVRRNRQVKEGKDKGNQSGGGWDRAQRRKSKVTTSH